MWHGGMAIVKENKFSIRARAREKNGGIGSIVKSDVMETARVLINSA